MINTKLIDKINNFSKLKYNWDSYNADTISKTSIDVAIDILKHFINHFSDDITIDVFPMRDGGIQFELDNIEIEINQNGKLKFILFDNNDNIIKEF